MASPPRITLKFSQLRKVRSFAKNTFGSTRVGRAMRLVGGWERRGWVDIFGGFWGGRGWGVGLVTGRR